MKNLAKNDSIVSKDDFVDFFHFYGFGIEDDNEFFDLIESVILLEKQTQQSKENQEIKIEKSAKNKEKTNKNTNEEKEAKEPKREDISKFIEKLKKNLKNFGKKSLFSLIKHFKFYDNNTKFITT